MQKANYKDFLGSHVAHFIAKNKVISFTRASITKLDPDTEIIGLNGSISEAVCYSITTRGL